MNSLLLDTLLGRPTSAIPVWLMRQAGRYLPEYRALKQEHGFLGLCRAPELACEITLQPIRRFDPDAAILFADIMLPAECLGFEIDFAPGPVVSNPIDGPEAVARLGEVDLSRVTYVFEAVETIRAALHAFENDRGRKALLGFAATPWTLACYLIAQGPYKHFGGTSIFAARYPEAFELLLQKLSELTVAYCRAQIAAGADAIQLFDSWAGLLSLEDFRNRSLPHTSAAIDALRGDAPVLLYANSANHLLPALKETNADALSLDWRLNLGEAAVATDKVLQGNLDPSMLFASAERLLSSIDTMLDAAPHGRYIANLGHGVLQATPPEAVELFVSRIQSRQI